MHPTLTPHRNVLADLVDKLEREANAARRRADNVGDELAQAVGELHVTDVAIHAGTIARERGIQDTLTNVVARLRSILGAHLTAIIDFGEVFDDIEARLAKEPSAYVPRIVAEVLDAKTVGGKRIVDQDLDVAIERAERYGDPIPGEVGQ